ncbi:MAG: sugar phosphate isomerase/epimerase [Verrucomicrobiales bacterium]|nr:sugar phosphate isomerase/epimerase [Verrucomicrobiales bacterium]
MIDSNLSQNRREFLGWAGGLTVAGATGFAVENPFERAGTGAHLQPGLAAYSFRNFFQYMRGKEREVADAKRMMGMPGFIDYCAENNVGAELTSYFFPPDVDSSDLLARCRHRAHVSGVPIAGTAVGNNFSYPKGAPERTEQMKYVKDWIDYSQIMGAPHIRVFAGKHPKGVSEEQAEQNAIEALEEAAEYAGKKGIFLGIENHDSIGTADRLLRIVKAVKSPWVGVNLDTGNFRSDNPYDDMEASAPYAVNVQVKVSLKVAGKEQEADFPRMMKILRDAGYRGFVVLEYEAAGDPYKEVPKVLAEMREAIG